MIYMLVCLSGDLSNTLKMRDTMIVRSRNDSYMAKRDKNQWKPKFWQNYNDCRLILWAWMLGEAAIVWAPVELAHNGYYLHSAVYVLTIVLIATPLLFSEICLTQYTNCDVISMWNFFPLLRCFGYGTIYLMVMKTVYMLVLTTWYLEYAVHGAMAQPPWNSCEEFDENVTRKICMVKRKNTSIFQNCLEVQSMYGGDCGMKTASRCFFEQEIGNHVTAVWPECLPRVKQTMALWCIGLTLVILTLKPKFVRIGVKLALAYVGLGAFLLVCIALGAGGTWLSTSISFAWMSFTAESLFRVLSKAFLAAGAGNGVAGSWSRGADFRSPAAMTAVAAPLLAVLASFMLSLVTFSGIKNMSFYHGDEENIVEIGDNYYFTTFGCMTEILIYFDDYISGFIWFTVTVVCVFVNTWLLFTYLKESLISNFLFAQIHHKISTILLAVLLVLLSYPFFCADLTPALLDAVDTTQLFTSLMFSISIYWIYGYYNHSVDIIFMIGVKASYFCKFCWLLNPLFILLILIMRCTFLAIGDHENSYKIETLGMNVDFLLYLILIGIYVFVILVAFVSQLVKYISARDFGGLFRPSDDWGPKDDILFRSRKMFVPEIMTTEFLYRQVKKHGYSKRNRVNVMKEPSTDSDESQCRQSTEWSVLTSN